MYPTPIADLELDIHTVGGAHTLTIRLTRPGDLQLNQSLTYPFLSHTYPVLIDKELLRTKASEGITAYGIALGEMLFPEPVAAKFAEMRAAARGSGEKIRVRLILPEDLHLLRWEALPDPTNGRSLALDSELFVSRYVIADDYAPLQLRPKGDLRVLIAVAAPRDAQRYNLPLIDAETESNVVATAFKPTSPITDLLAHMSKQKQATINTNNTKSRLGVKPIRREIFAPGSSASLSGQRIQSLEGLKTKDKELGLIENISATWDRLDTTLREGYDILYLVAHGVLRDCKPWLYLVDEDGNADRRSGKDLADLLRSLGERRPRLVMLASCESAGDGYTDTLAALGPQIAQAGVPAVLAMQGQFSIDTNKKFASTFFSELMRDGAIDRAANSARLAVKDRQDWWMPVLYSRLKDGQIWHDTPSSYSFPPSEERRLDAAMPAQCVVGQPAQVWVQLCLPDSVGFSKELPVTARFVSDVSQQDIRNQDIIHILPEPLVDTPQLPSLRVELTALNFVVADRPPDEDVLTLLPGIDSPRMVFQLIPRNSGQCIAVQVNIKQHRADGQWSHIGNARVETRVFSSQTTAKVSSIVWNVSNSTIVTKWVPWSRVFMQGSDREELQSHIHSYQQSLETARDRGDEHGVEVMSFNLGNIYAALGEQRTASKFYEQNLEIVHKLGDRRSQIAALASLEKIHIDLGEASAATRFHEQNLAIARSLKEAPRDATRLRDHWELGLTLARQGRPEAALVHLEQGLVFLKQIEHPRANEMDVMIKQFRASGKLTDLSADMGLPHGSDIKTGH